MRTDWTLFVGIWLVSFFSGLTLGAFGTAILMMAGRRNREQEPYEQEHT